MDIMPHIKCLIDDLVSITENIVVKRQDIADNNDMDLSYSVIPRYYQYILENKFSVGAMGTVPIDLINSIPEWEEDPYYTYIEYRNPNTFPYIENASPNNKIIYNTSNPDDYCNGKWNNINIGDRYIQINQTPNDMVPVTSTRVETVNKNIVGNEKYVYDNCAYMYLNDEVTRFDMELDDVSDTILLTVPYDIMRYEQFSSPIKVSENDDGLYADEKFYFGEMKDSKFTPYDISDYKTYGEYQTYLKITSPGEIIECDRSMEYDSDAKYYLFENGEYTFIGLDEGSYLDYINSGETVYRLQIDTMYIPLHMVSDIYDYMGNRVFDDTRTYATIKEYSEEDKDYIFITKAVDLSIDIDRGEWYSYEYYSTSVADDYGEFYDGYYVFYEKIETEMGPQYVKIDSPKFNIERTTNPKYFIYKPKNCKVYIANRAIDEYVAKNMATNISLLDKKYYTRFLEKAVTYITNKYCPDRNDSTRNVPIYRGEFNNYYRTLNGLPPIEDMAFEPKINMHNIDSKYEDVNKFIYELSDHDISVIENNGMLDDYINEYPDKTYLRYLGKNRIDCIAARNAEQFDILRTGSYVNNAHYNLFIEKYSKARDYVMIKYYFPELYGDQVHYLSFITYLIVTYAMCMCITDSGSILINNEYQDADTVDIKLESFALNIFDNIPLLYRKNISKNLEKLIHNKAIDAIYDIIYKIFNINDIDIYKYYLYKKPNSDGGTDLEMTRVPIDSEHAISSMTSIENILDYGSITSSDKYWGVYETDKAIKELIESYDFNYCESKYIGIDIIFNVSKLIMATSVLLNYIMESAGISSDIFIKPSFSENEHKLKDLMIFMFAINADLCGYDGNIPIDILQIAQIYKYDLEKELQESDRFIKAKELYEENMTDDDSLFMNKLTVEKPNKYNSSIDVIATKYLSNGSDDGIYGKLTDKIINATSFDEYQCYRQIYDCVYKNNCMKELFKLEHPIFEKVGSIKNDGKDNYIDWTVSNMDNIWIKISIDSAVIQDIKGRTVPIISKENDKYYLNYDNRKILTILGYPPVEFNKLNSDIGAFIDTSKLKESKLTTDNINLVDIYVKYDLKKYILDSVNIIQPDAKIYDEFYISSNIGEPENIYSDDYSNKMIYIEYEQNRYGNTAKNIYILTDKALTFKSWLKNNNEELYDLYVGNIVVTDEHSLSERLTYLNDLYLEVINDIESSISDDMLIRQLNLEYLDYDSISSYIKYVLEVFKSFTIDVATIDSIYKVDDKSTEAIRIFNKLPIMQFDIQSSKMNLLSTVNITHSDILLTDSNYGFKLNDELIIE